MRFTFRGSQVWCNMCGVKMVPRKVPLGFVVEICPGCGASFRVGKRPADMPKGLNRGTKRRKR